MRAGQSGGPDLDQIRRRQLEEDAERAVVGASVTPLTFSPVAESGPAGAEGRKVGGELKQRAADRFERRIQDHRHTRLQHEAAKLDIEADGQAMAGAMLRLKERPALQQPPRSLLATAAAERKARVRAQRMVPKKNGSASGGFGKLPHPGLWKAQPLEQVQARTTPAPAAPRRSAPLRQTISIA